MKIDMWQTIFMLLTIIPVAKMINTIYMKLIVRQGTINEEKWAGAATAGIGMIAGLTRLGRGVGGAFGKGGGAKPSIQGGQQPVTTRRSSGGHGLPGGYLGPDSPYQESIAPRVPSGGGGPFPHIPTGPAGGGGPKIPSPGGAPVDLPKTPSADGSSGGSSAGVPPGYVQRPSGLIVPGGSPSGPSARDAGADTGNGGAGVVDHQGSGQNKPPQRTGFDAMVDGHGEMRGKAQLLSAEAGGLLGGVSGPIGAAGLGATMGLVGGAIAGTFHTVAGAARGIARERGEGGFSGALKRYTGDQQTHVAAARLITATVTAPLGHHVQRHASNAAAYTARAIGRASGHMAQTGSRLRG